MQSMLSSLTSLKIYATELESINRSQHNDSGRLQNYIVSSRPLRQKKINKETLELNDTIDQMDLRAI
jgi:hypothetical protein